MKKIILNLAYISERVTRLRISRIVAYLESRPKTAKPNFRNPNFFRPQGLNLREVYRILKNGLTSCVNERAHTPFVKAPSPNTIYVVSDL